jgi:hypothetical protein
MAIIDLQRKLAEAGRIRIGTQVPSSNGRSRPSKLDAFRFTSRNVRAIDAIAGIYGGIPQVWEGAPTGQRQYEVFTEAAEIDVQVPPEHMALSQWLELWSGGGCLRRCDGKTDTISEGPCVCRQLDDDDVPVDRDHPRCKAQTRLSVMLPAYPSSGLWRLDTGSYYGAVEIAGAVEMGGLLAQATGRALLTGVLRLEQREVRRPDEPTKEFAVPVLDLDLSALAQSAPAAITAPAPTAALPSGPTPIRTEAPPSLAEQIAAADTPPPRVPRSNAAEPIPATRARPRTAAEAQSSRPATPAPATGDRPERTTGGASQASIRRLFAIMRGKPGIPSERAGRLLWASAELAGAGFGERVLQSFDDLSQKEVSGLVNLAEGKPFDHDDRAPRSSSSAPPPRDDAPQPNDPPADYGYDEEPF